MNVVLTAPIPGNSTPNLPLGGAIFPGFSIPLLLEPGSLLHSFAQFGLLPMNDPLYSITARNNACPVAIHRHAASEPGTSRDHRLFGKLWGGDRRGARPSRDAV